MNTVKLADCGARLMDAQAAEWNATHPSSEPPPPLQLTYEQCLDECGRGLGDISWDVFTQSVTAWFLPWIVLLFQIPFGAECEFLHRYPIPLSFVALITMGVDPHEDIYSFLLTIGSPSLAAYSLQITQLNARWLAQVFSDIEYPNSNAIPTAISALQHIPIRLSSNPSLLPSLIVLPENDRYWQRLLKSAKKIRRWSLPLFMNFAWVIVAALLTIIDSFYRPIPGEIGYGAVASLAYLLPLIIGWLHVGSEPEPGHLRESLEEANDMAYVATDQSGLPILAKDLVSQQKWAIEFVKRSDVGPVRSDERRMNPIFNYSRVFTWSQTAETIFTFTKNAATKAEQGLSVGGGAVDDRNGTADEVIQYCEPESTPFEKFFGAPRPIIPQPLGSPRSPSTAIGLLPFFTANGIQEPASIWATDVWNRVALASCLALGLQWGTTGAAMAIHYRLHPIGLGCRAVSLMMYGICGTISFLLLLASSILAHLSRPQPGPTHRFSRFRGFQNAGAIIFRRLGKGLAMVSGLGIVVVSFIQPLGVFDNCWCSTTTLDRPGQLVAFLTGDFGLEWGIIKVWIGCLVLAFSTALLFGFSIFLGTPRSR